MEKKKVKEINKVAENKSLDEKTKTIRKEIQKNIDLNTVDDIIKDNKMEFEFEGVNYKLDKLTYKQRLEVNEKKLEKYMTLLQVKDEKGKFKYKSEDNLKTLYLERGIDIGNMEFQIINCEAKKKNYYLKLGKLLEEKAPEKELEKYRTEIEKINEKEQLISFKKTQLMESSIESQVFIFVYSYLTYLLTSKLVKGKDLGEGNKEADKWIKAWSSYDEFINVKEDLVNKAAFYVSLSVKPNLDL